VKRHTESFARALRAALREDPDVVLVGELRDLETISIALETAETGHLVFGTLHTTTAPSTLDRIIDQFPPEQQSQIRVMLSESLRGVVDPVGLLLEDRQRGLVDRLALAHASPPIRTRASSNTRSQLSHRHPDGSAGRIDCSPQKGQ
jgi:Tfp pilus assembly pilus retraction ATPase PilT